jgi:hypothetical protein
VVHPSGRSRPWLACVSVRTRVVTTPTRRTFLVRPSGRSRPWLACVSVRTRAVTTRTRRTFLVHPPPRGPERTSAESRRRPSAGAWCWAEARFEEVPRRAEEPHPTRPCSINRSPTHLLRRRTRPRTWSRPPSSNHPRNDPRELRQQRRPTKLTECFRQLHNYPFAVHRRWCHRRQTHRTRMEDTYSPPVMIGKCQSAHARSRLFGFAGSAADASCSVVFLCVQIARQTIQLRSPI